MEVIMILLFLMFHKNIKTVKIKPLKILCIFKLYYYLLGKQFNLCHLPSEKNPLIIVLTLSRTESVVFCDNEGVFFDEATFAVNHQN